ncbi:MAG: Eco57I restriction-modification methylase domain-containing protein [Moraxella sp.]|nr:Eco57I restriction-modification methylase domain-containing protein [Moraxella sp.]
MTEFAINSNITPDLDKMSQGQLSLFAPVYNPDVLDFLSSLSNDEVFTSPKLANLMLDLLPNEIWSNANAKFLDPVCKLGVFLREIVKRLDKGLENQIPDRQTRINHICKNQVYGIAITYLTALLSRRSVYCAKIVNSSFSICDEFDDEMGNIIFGKSEHIFDNGKCRECGASEGVFGKRDGLENHAYAFIHSNIDTVFKEILTMKFDVIIGNPPYQLNVGNDGGNSSKAKAIYHLFIEQAMKLKPQYLVMITPSRWMTRSVEGISPEWIDNMLSSKNFKIIHDFESSKECFPNLSQPIEGGVNYFLWEKFYNGKCEYIYHKENGNIFQRNDFIDANNIGIVIRDPNSFKIIGKIEKFHKDYFLCEDDNFSSLVSPKDFFY